MGATLRYHDEQGSHLVHLGDDAIVVGRLSDCAIRVEDSTVTRRHARILKEAGRYWIQDLGSDNGVFVNGARTERCALAHRDKVHCGRLLLEYSEE